MKKMFKYASLGAIALVGAISFSACSSSDEIVDNPDYNPVDNTVNTQIAFSLSKGGAKKAATRQTAARSTHCSHSSEGYRRGQSQRTGKRHCEDD